MTRLFVLLSAVLWLFAEPTYAATECMFNESYNVNLSNLSSEQLVVYDDTPPVSGYKEIQTQNNTFNPDKKITSTCNTGQEGQALLSNADGYTGPLTRYIEKDGKKLTLYETNIEGLYYSVKIYSDQCPEMGGEIPPVTDYTSLYDIGDDREKECLKTDKPYYFILSFFIDPDYRPVQSDAPLSSHVNSIHGKFMLSGSKDNSDEYEVTVNQVHLNGILKKQSQSCTAFSTLLNEMQNNLAQKNLVVTTQHRGDFSSSIPENSLGAFHKSYERCRANIETDVRATSDGKLVLFHDLNIGKMLEPTYDPVHNTGPNAALGSLTLEQLKQKYLVNSTFRTPTSYKVPTLEEMLQDYLKKDGQSLIYLETKSSSVIMPTAWTLYEMSQANPNSSLLQRVILKVNMAEYPSPDLWSNALINKGIPSGTNIMIEPVIKPADANTIDNLPDSVFSCPPGVLDLKALCAVRAWATAPSTLAPVVSVLLKDSSEFIRKTHTVDQQGIAYDAPTSLELSNTKDGTMARMVAIIKTAGKALDIFSPVPDYMLWKDLEFNQDTVNDANIPGLILVRRAFYNNDSSCCYQLKDKLNTTIYAAEIADYRMVQGWLRSVGVNVVTTDDADSVNVYNSDIHYLDTVLTPSVSRPPFDMQSLLAWQLGYANTKFTMLASKGRQVGGGYVYSLYTNPDSWAWTYPIEHDHSYYSDTLMLYRQSNGLVRIKSAYLQPTQCLWSKADSTSWTYTYWKGESNCSTDDSLWRMIPDGNSVYRFTDSNTMSLGWEFSSKLYYFIDYGYVFVNSPSSITDEYLWKVSYTPE